MDALPSLTSPLPSTHQDFEVLNRIVNVLLLAASSEQRLQTVVGQIIRDCVDRVIQTPKTGRRLYTDLQNSEKTYIGTAVEIELRSQLGLERGPHLDLAIAGYDVDVKFAQGYSWMIPPEAVDMPCILVSANDEQALFSFGAIVARQDYLNPGANRDQKKTIQAKHRASIWWLAEKLPYPKNFWLTVSQESIRRISNGTNGNQRMISLFREVQDRPISRKVIEDVAQQLDPTRRIRADKSRGTRNVLEADGIFVLNGFFDAPLIQALGLPTATRSEWISHQFKDHERKIATKFGLTL